MLPVLAILEDNAELAQSLDRKALPRKEYFQFVTDDGWSKSETLR